jgi:hypothetical protein
MMPLRLKQMMTLRLNDEWKLILRKAWSIRLILLAGLLSGIEVALPLIDGSLPRGGFAALSLLVTGGAFVARLLAQKDFSDDRQP